MRLLARRAFAERAGPPVESKGLLERVINPCRCGLEQDLEIESVTTSPKKDRPPPAVFSEDPEKELEEKLRMNPGDPGAKVDVGSDESMDASDPPSVGLPDHDGPVPSSGFEEEDGEFEDHDGESRS
jgi:hypothetical protein